jgi:LysR family cys regulon transcriptional activator
MRAFAPHLSRELVEAAVKCSSRDELDALFADIDLPVR